MLERYFKFFFKRSWRHPECAKSAEAAMDLFRGADLSVRRAFASDQAGHAQDPAFNLRNSIHKACQPHVRLVGRNKIAFPLVTCASAKALATFAVAIGE